MDEPPYAISVDSSIAVLAAENLGFELLDGLDHAQAGRKEVIRKTLVWEVAESVINQVSDDDKLFNTDAEAERCAGGFDYAVDYSAHRITFAMK